MRGDVGDSFRAVSPSQRRLVRYCECGALCFMCVLLSVAGRVPVNRAVFLCPSIWCCWVFPILTRCNKQGLRRCFASFLVGDCEKRRSSSFGCVWRWICCCCFCPCSPAGFSTLQSTKQSARECSRCRSIFSCRCCVCCSCSAS